MSITEFSRTYGVDYGTTYAAATLIPFGRMHGTDYDERDLIDAVEKVTTRRRDDTLKKLERYNTILKQCAMARTKIGS